ADGQQDKMDGLSVAYDAWRFNVRTSNTEPVMRLNVETKGDKELLAEKTAEILEIIGGEEA
ncbi:MAG: phosphomannomutase, partial [Phascolarctobacterium sp.]|nr:phosphomannomutase [Phascolarctobacterium sp.]